MKFYINPEMCSACGGVCCKMCPGLATPRDIINLYANENGQDYLHLRISEGKLRQAIQRAMDSGDWVIQRVLYPDRHMRNRTKAMRPRAKGESPRELAYHAGPCVFLTDTGCKLAPEKRPEECRLLEPESDRCIVHGRIGQQGDKWIHWQPLLNEFLSAYCK